MKKYLSVNFDLDKMADVLDELPLWSAPFGLRLLDYVNYKPAISVLDIGCGTGFPLTELA
jgi:protein-L-isoaspartate O-methyltransferase